MKCPFLCPKQYSMKCIFLILILFCILSVIIRYSNVLCPIIGCDNVRSTWRPKFSFDSNYNKRQNYSNSAPVVTVSQFRVEKPICQVNSAKLKNIKVPIDRVPHSFSNLLDKPWAQSVSDGFWTPPNCTPNITVAIVIPYRNREAHLKVFINHMIPFLQQQMLAFKIMCVEQDLGTTFNRAALFNIGYDLLTNHSDFKIKFNCFIFHDVDLLPVNLLNFYDCSSSPLHMSVAIDKFNYRLLYASLFGGIVAFKPEHFVKVNGFSNIFYGWGGEDDDMSTRVRMFYKINRRPKTISRYIMIKHTGDKGNERNNLRFRLLQTSAKRYKKDGLSTLEYSIVAKNNSNCKLFSKYTIQLPEKKIRAKWLK